MPPLTDDGLVYVKISDLNEDTEVMEQVALEKFVVSH